MIKKFLILFFLAFNLLISLPLSSFGYEKDEITNISVYERLNPAIVSVDAKLPDGISSGSGCIIDKNGTILTSSHVIDSSTDISVTISNGDKYPAMILEKLGANKDLALLKIQPKLPLKTIHLGDSSNIRVGQKVLAIGNPFGFNGTLTEGIVSRIDYKKNKIQTDAAINPGSSGGPLVDTEGNVIGINQAIYNPYNNISNIGIGFAIPINEVKEMLKS